MHRCVIAYLVLGQQIPTTSASAQRQLCGKVTYSRSRPKRALVSTPGYCHSSRGPPPSQVIPLLARRVVAGLGAQQYRSLRHHRAMVVMLVPSHGVGAVFRQLCVEPHVQRRHQLGIRRAVDKFGSRRPLQSRAAPSIGCPGCRHGLANWLLLSSRHDACVSNDSPCVLRGVPVVLGTRGALLPARTHARLGAFRSSRSRA